LHLHALRSFVVFLVELSNRHISSFVNEGGSTDMVGKHCLAGMYAAILTEDPRRCTAFMLRLCRTLFCQPVPAESRAFWLYWWTHLLTLASRLDRLPHSLDPRSLGVTASLVIGHPASTFWLLVQALPISQRDIVWVTEVETAVEACSELLSKAIRPQLSRL
jgi:hypothetical protein